MEQLPNELIDNIADTLDTTDFLSLYNTNKQLRRILAPQLWRQLTLGTCSKAGIVELANSIPVEPPRYKRRICLNSKQSVSALMKGLVNFPELYEDVLSAVRLFNLSITFDDHPSSPPQGVALTKMYHDLVKKLTLPFVEDIEVELYADEKDCQVIAETVFEKWSSVPCCLSVGLRRGSGTMERSSLPGSPEAVQIKPLNITKWPAVEELRIYYMSIKHVLTLLHNQLPHTLQKLLITQQIETGELKSLQLDKCPNLKKLAIQDSLILTDSYWVPPTVTQLQYKERSQVIPDSAVLQVCNAPQVESLKVELSTGHSLDYMKFTNLQDLELEEGPWSTDGDAVERAIKNMIIPNVGTLTTLRFHDVEYKSIQQLIENTHGARIKNLIILGCRDSFQYENTGSMSKKLPHLKALVLDLPDRESPENGSPISEQDMMMIDGGFGDGGGGGAGNNINTNNNNNDNENNVEQSFARFIYQFLINCPQLANIYGVAWPDCFVPRKHRYFKDDGPDILYGVSMRQINLELIQQEVEGISKKRCER